MYDVQTCVCENRQGLTFKKINYVVRDKFGTQRRNMQRKRGFKNKKEKKKSMASVMPHAINCRMMQTAKDGR